MPPLLFYEYAMNSLGLRERDERRKETEDNMVSDRVDGLGWGGVGGEAYTLPPADGTHGKLSLWSALED
jgi:hypothetical protein